MPRQHEPPAGETASPVAVRRAVPVPPPGEDPGAGLGPRTPDPDPAAPVPIPESPTPAPRRLFGRRSGSAATEPGSAGQQQQQQAAGDGPEPESAVGVLFAGNDDGPDDPNTAGQAPGRPRGPMLAAAAIAGAVLISVPFLVLGLSDDDNSRTVKTAPVGGTTLDPGLSDDRPAADYTAESPSPSASPSPSPSKSPSKSASPSVAAPPPAPVVSPSAAKKTASPKPKKTVAKPSARELANAASASTNVGLKNADSGMCADIPGEGHGSVAGPVNQHSCGLTSADNMLWDLRVSSKNGGPQGASLFVAANRKDGLCLDVPNYGTVDPGTAVAEYFCDATTADNQLWWLEPRPGGTYWIRNLASNLCLSVRGGAAAGENARLQVVQCIDTATSALHWTLVR
ncbi:RICIN domain-containing protein [Streptomyces shenzhenensis]|uniref:RICIN domain-containing protein n=1 Tax=Streptomyces shenzhenensis TaxID=943815 RepID=UPI0036A8A329